MRKIGFILTCLVLLVSAPFLVACKNKQAAKQVDTAVETVSEKQTYSKWDVNQDGQINISDVTEILNIKANENASAEDIARADVNQNGVVSDADVDALLEYLSNN